MEGINSSLGSRFASHALQADAWQSRVFPGIMSGRSIFLNAHIFLFLEICLPEKVPFNLIAMFFSAVGQIMP
jgi:hypothetical protein